VVGVGITAAVYGAVALIVKADDAGVALARNGTSGPLGSLTRAVGRGLVRGMPVFLRVLATIGTAAMVWVGGGIIVHGLELYGLPWIGHTIHDLALAAGRAAPALPAVAEWLVSAAGSGLFGLALGALIIPLVGYVIAPVWNAMKGLVRRSPADATG
jgi:predicted DNA repair protein MutK